MTIMDKQEIFDKVVMHLFTQKRQAGIHGKCYYRMTDQFGNILKCAIGCFIDDEDYTEDLESKPVDFLFKAKNITKNITYDINKLQNILSKLGGQSNSHFLSELQYIHDFSFSWNKNGLTNNALGCLRKLADDYQLDPSVLKNRFLKTN